MTYHGFFGEDIYIIDDTTVVVHRDTTRVVDLGPDLERAFDEAERILTGAMFEDRSEAYCIPNASPNTTIIYR